MKLVRSAGHSVSDSFTALSMVAQNTSKQRRQRKRVQEGLAEPAERPSPTQPRWENINATKAKEVVASPINDEFSSQNSSPQRKSRPKRRNRNNGDWSAQQNEDTFVRKQLQEEFRAERNREADKIKQNRTFHKAPRPSRPVFEMYHKVPPHIAAMKEATNTRKAIEEAARMREEQRSAAMRQGHSGNPNEQEFDAALGPAALEYEKAKALKNTRAHVAKVDDFLSQLPPLGVSLTAAQLSEFANEYRSTQ
jgi:hypothetical protein